MKHITSKDFSITNSAVALGKFECIHLGHQLLLEEIKNQKKNQLNSVVFTFDMNPRLALSEDTNYQQIYTRKERYEILKFFGIDVLIEYPFTKEFASLTPEAFIRDVLVGQVGAKYVVVGRDFRFGKNRSGGIEDLERLSEELGYKLIIKDKLQDDSIDVSSSRIRQLIEKGQMEEVKELLGRPYSIYGKVVHGKALGRTIQIPTANQLADTGKLMPPNGVYISMVNIGEEITEPYYGITNIGVKPTVGEANVIGVETYIFDFDQDIYDQDLIVGLLHFCRPEMKFESIESLIKQMQEDIRFGKSYIL